jgi:hypothetical protein
VLIAANLAATVLRFLLFRAWVFPDRQGETPSQVVASYNPAPHNPASPTYATAPHAQASHAHAAHPPLPQRPAAPPSPYDTSSYDTAQFRAGEAADRTWGDATMQMQAVRPHDHDPRDTRDAR